MDYGLIFWPENVLMMDLFLTNTFNFTKLDLCELLVDYCDVSISCLNSQSDGTHSLQKIRLGVSVILNFSKSVSMKKQTILDGLRASNFSAITFFKWTTLIL